jgi:hypothetical protein
VLGPALPARGKVMSNAMVQTIRKDTWNRVNALLLHPHHSIDNAAVTSLLSSNKCVLFHRWFIGEARAALRTATEPL